MPSWLQPPPGPSKTANAASWLAPSPGGLHSNGCSQLQTLNPKCESDAFQKQKRRVQWLNPSPCGEKLFKPFTGERQEPKPEVELTLGMAILCKPLSGQQITQNGDAQAAIHKIFARPCPNSKSASGVCVSCETGFRLEEVAQFRNLFQHMNLEERSNLLNTCYTTGKESDSTRVQWKLLGKRICLKRLCEVLGCSARTFVKAVHGEVDMRFKNGRQCGEARISVDQYFFELYNSAAEFLPEDPACKVEDVDNSISADSTSARLGSDHHHTSPALHSMLPLFGWDPAQTYLQDASAMTLDDVNLPRRYVQHQKPIDLWWQYLAWVVVRCPGKASSWTTFWKRWHERALVEFQFVCTELVYVLLLPAAELFSCVAFSIIVAQ